MTLLVSTPIHVCASGSKFTPGPLEKSALITDIVLATLAIAAGAAMLFQAHGIISQLSLIGSVGVNTAFITGGIAVGAIGCDLLFYAILQVRALKQAASSNTGTPSESTPPEESENTNVSGTTADTSSLTETSNASGNTTFSGTNESGSPSVSFNSESTLPEGRGNTNVSDASDTPILLNLTETSETNEPDVSLNSATHSENNAPPPPPPPAPPAPPAPAPTRYKVATPTRVPSSGSASGTQAMIATPTTLQQGRAALRSNKKPPPMPANCFNSIRKFMENGGMYKSKVRDADACMIEYPESDQSMKEMLKVHGQVPLFLKTYLYSLHEWVIKGEGDLTALRAQANRSYFEQRHTAYSEEKDQADRGAHQTDRAALVAANAERERQAAAQAQQEFLNAIDKALNHNIYGTTYSLPKSVTNSYSSVQFGIIVGAFSQLDRVNPRSDRLPRSLTLLNAQLQLISDFHQFVIGHPDQWITGAEAIQAECDEAWSMIEAILNIGISSELLGLSSIS